MTPDERELFDEKLKGIVTLINARFENVDTKLDQIHTEAKRTNSRVTHLEEYKEYAQGVIATRVTQDMVQACHTKIENMEKSLEDVKFFTRHPKLFVAGFVLIVILTLATFIESNPLKAFYNEPEKTEQVVPK